MSPNNTTRPVAVGKPPAINFFAETGTERDVTEAQELTSKLSTHDKPTKMAAGNVLQEPNGSQQFQDPINEALASIHKDIGGTGSISNLSLEELIGLNEDPQEEDYVDWAKEESPSFEPNFTATSPEVCLWATTKAITDDYEWIMYAAADEVVGKGVPRIASCMRRAIRHLYRVPNCYGILFPPKAMGFKEIDKYMYFPSFGQRKPGIYRLGCKGFKYANDPEVPVIPYTPNGMRSDCHGPYNTRFYPQPSRMNQVWSVDEFDNIKRSDSLTQLDGSSQQYQYQDTCNKTATVTLLRGMSEDDDMPLPGFSGDNDQYHGPTKDYSGNVSDSDNDSDNDSDGSGTIVEDEPEIGDADSQTNQFIDFDGDHGFSGVIYQGLALVEGHRSYMLAFSAR
ncbi:uncharacterized protein K452DRAFT_296705 [Aplosporella prunicola CBS 121167]|uniref:Uncharacterized protein n=1 Tax=Aplosporella prunicola CBS 121167 TaxID=1176127 RepID=A0A6A6BJC0_9PEZI|nr:uncharacterized protein K452DRAFT_296705 [Aplosporella prunicola CBS 121167]KAF2143718.1 hypothetical protein K452DRAFT_296705 [Aplosporella prunicola CBS 121167]